jgi:uncharacterized protein YgiM (DUF1202 family)
MSAKVIIRAALAAACVTTLLFTPRASHAQTPGQNLLKNPGFDWPAQTNGDVCAPGWEKGNAITPKDWTPFWACKTGDERNQDRVNRPPEFRVMTVDIAADRVRSYPTSGSFFTFWALNQSMGLYQMVNNVTPGTKLRFSAWANLLTTDSDELPLNSSRAPGGLQARACIHTTGNVVLNPNFNDPAIVCGAWIRPYDTWGEMWVEATAAFGQVAVIIDTTAEYPVKHNDVHVDDASLVVVGQGGAAAAVAPAAVSAPQPQAQAQAAPANDALPRVAVKTPTANVRAAPSYTGQIIASAPQGMSFAVKAYTSDKEWWQIEYSGGQGGVAYIHNSVVDMNAAAQRALTGGAAVSAPASAAPAAAAAPPAAAQTVAGAAAQVIVSTGGDRLNIRSAANAAASIVGRVANGASLEVKGISPDKAWWRITYPGTADGTAWVMAQWVTPNAAAKQLAGL